MSEWPYFDGPIFDLFPESGNDPGLGGQPPDNSPRLGGEKRKIQCQCGRWFPDETGMIAVFEVAMHEPISACEHCAKRRDIRIQSESPDIVEPSRPPLTYLFIDRNMFAIEGATVYKRTEAQKI